ncbi:DDE-type integrase/transposase/recombinase [Sulfitobacter sp. F26204]|uniref:Mu transposase C-terminal domain-containing protein n=1 Tax=Sulfitobacter sp. F26204 TaxID=2996014 RepID=UPI00225E221F|nr:DDE-type integrase/transposase/recombinase [Sulfitobacter sp. F26204]MCX7561439.1 DDE-type integrase/transposase/recombinase [Sulfitobacter sp. F26204]
MDKLDRRRRLAKETENSEDRALAIERGEILRPILELGRTGHDVGPMLLAAAEEMGVSRSSAWEYYRRLKQNDGRSSALLPKRRGPKRGSRRLGREVEAIIERVLRQYYLVLEPPSFLRIVGEIQSECGARGFRRPTRRTIKARLDAMDQREVLRKRKGAKAAKQVFEARAGRLEVEQPLEVVQIDHTLADIVLVDQVERKPLARPWLTLAIDVATRVVLGAYVTFDAPSVLSICFCLDHCVWPKSIRTPSSLEQLYWPTAGIPQAIHVDNGRDFRSDAFRSACTEWGISIKYRPPGRVHFGGHIERLIGTTMGAVHVLPGTTQSSPKDKGEYDSAAKASMTLDEFMEWLNLEICRYHNTRHSGLRRTPLAAWADLGGDDAGRQVVDTDAFRISFLPSERRQLGRTGINLFSIGYWSDAFAPMVGRRARKVTVKYTREICRGYGWSRTRAVRSPHATKTYRVPRYLYGSLGAPARSSMNATAGGYRRQFCSGSLKNSGASPMRRGNGRLRRAWTKNAKHACRTTSRSGIRPERCSQLIQATPTFQLTR